MGKRILTGIIVILSVVFFLVGLRVVGSLLIKELNQKMDYHRQELVAEIDRVMGKNINRLDMAVKHTLENKEVQKAAEDFLWNAYISPTGNDIKAKINNKINHALWIYLGAIEAVTEKRPQFVENLLRGNPDGIFYTSAGVDIDWKQYMFYQVKPEVEAETEVVAPKAEAAEEIVKEAPAEETPADVPAEGQTPPQKEDDAAKNKTRKLLDQL